TIPLIRSLIGLSPINKAIINARISDNWNARKKFQHFLKILYVHLSESKSDNRIINAEPIIGETANMTIMTKANGYVIIPEKVTRIEKGSEIQVNLLSGFSFVSRNPIDFM
ncbi:MAG: hypothetical protein AB7F53_07280, partial [Nitrososphaeraceae archaeon]